MKSAISLIALVMVGCADTECMHEFYSGGLSVCHKIETKPEYLQRLVEKTVQIVESAVQEYYPEVIDLSEELEAVNASLVFIDMPMAADCVNIAPNSRTHICTQLVQGVNINNNITVTFSNCNSAGTLGHELLHSVETIYLGESGSEHTAKMLFREGSESYEDTVESKIKRKVNEHCVAEVIAAMSRTQ